VTPPPRNLRIMMTADAVGGAWTFATALARAIAVRHGAVHLVVMGPPPAPHQLASIRDVSNIFVEVTDLALEWQDPGGVDVGRARGRLEAIARRVRPDLVHLNSYREALFAWPAPVLLTAHSCVRSWWRACHGGEPVGAGWQTYAENVRAALHAVPWIAPTQTFRRCIASLYSTPAPGGMIWNGIEPTAPAPIKEPFVLAAGRLWDEAKNLAALEESARTLDWPIRLAGEGTPGPRRAVAKSHFVFLGALSRNNLQTVMRRAAIFASPALYEPFGLAVLEAAQAGCALALADIPTFRELWDGAALFADPADERQFGALLARLRHDEVLRTKMGRAAARRAARYTLAAMTDGYLGAYGRVRHRHATSSCCTARWPTAEMGTPA
jgi:glycosyltransferase involved in cell wall biosynthesis